MKQIRYMAPEVGLTLGYSLPSDVYSFGILLWEICALEKPFAHITCSDEFDRSVFEEGERPVTDDCWPETMTKLMNNCWRANPSDRPTMLEVKSNLFHAIPSKQVGGKRSPIKTSRPRMSRARGLSFSAW